jgi:hypothetical protein
MLMQLKLEETYTCWRDELYENRINPIATFTTDGLKSGVIKRFKLKKQLLIELVLEDFLFKQENLFLLYLSDYCLNKMIQLLSQFITC